MDDPTNILEAAYTRAIHHLDQTIISDATIVQNIIVVCRHPTNKAGIRVLLSSALATIHHPSVDIRKPYTGIAGTDTFSGRRYDEGYISDFINRYALPANTTTAYLTPAFRDKNIALTKDVKIGGKRDNAYASMLQLLDDVYIQRITANELLEETIRQLVLFRNERQNTIDILTKNLKVSRGEILLSAERIITLIQQHMASPRSSRLPVLVVSAAYKAAETFLGEQFLPLKSHNAADKQTGALGDIEITLLHDHNVRVSYEMKQKRVSFSDIDNALQKVTNTTHTVEQYIFITTDVIDRDVADYAATIYDKTGVEFVILDCIGFLRHFLHLFHRIRMDFIDAYQELVLSEPNSAVSQELKTAFLALREAAHGNDTSS